MSGANCWNPLLETLPEAQLRRLQLLKFQRQLAYVYERSPFYRRKLDEAGVKPETVQTLDDVRRVPPTTKAELQQAQGKGTFPYGPCLTVPTDEVIAYHQTSGTTGRPIRQADSRRDWEWWSECWATLLWAQGFRPSDRVFLPFSYGVFVAFWAAHYACEKIGCEVVPGGGLSTQDRLLKMKELKVSALLCTPTYGLHLAETATKMGLDLARDLNVNKIVCAGEPGASIPATKRRLETYWGARVFDHAGATEGGAWGFECPLQPGHMHLNEAFFLVEVVHPETGDPVASGEQGELLVTPLDRRAQPYLRFALRDLGQLERGPCPCGRTFGRLKGGVLGRRDDLTKVRGVLFSPTSVEPVVRGVEALGDEYQVVIQKKGVLDELTVRAELRPNGGDAAALKTELQRALRLTTGLRCNVELVELGTLPRFEVKAKRFQDLR